MMKRTLLILCLLALPIVSGLVACAPAAEPAADAPATTGTTGAEKPAEGE